MNELLNFEKEFDIILLDKIVEEAFNPSHPNKEQSEQFLVEFKEHPSSWTRVDTILNNSVNSKTQFFALQILESAIKTRWSLFSLEQRNGLKDYILQFILKTSTQKETYVLKRFNIILVEILKKEFPRSWSTFITDLLSASQLISMDVCRNSLEILKRLNEEIFEFSDQISTIKKRALQKQFKTEYMKIYNLIKSILENPSSIDYQLLETVFSSFIVFCKHMGNEFLFKTNIIELLCKYLYSPHTISSIKCLREIIECASYKDSVESFNELGITEQNYSTKIVFINKEVVNFSKFYLQKVADGKLSKAYQNFQPEEREILSELSFLLSSLYDNNFLILEKNDFDFLKQGLEFLIKASRVKEPLIFSKAMNFYHNFVLDLYEEYPFRTQPKKELRRSYYQNILDSLIDLLINKMPRPEEVFITTNEYGEVVKEKLTEVEKIDFFKKVKDTLFYLACINPTPVRKYFCTKLDKLQDTNFFSHKEINKIAWSAGCISEAFGEEDEYSFFIAVLKDLLSLCELKSAKSDKAIVASNIIYLIGQYHRFLLSYLSFLKVLIKKIFEFMHESHEGIQDMACDTFLRIAEKCSSKFYPLEEDGKSIVICMLNNAKQITSDLEHYQKRIIYQALVYAIINSPLSHRMKLLEILFNSFSDLNLSCFEFEDNKIKEASHIIKSYSLVFVNMPDSIDICYKTVLPFFIDFYNKINQTEYNRKSKELLKNDLIELMINVIKEGMNSEFLDFIFKTIIIDFKNDIKKNYLILDLGTKMIKKLELNINQENYLINQLIFIEVFDADENSNLALSYFNLAETFIEKKFINFFNSIFSDNKFNQFINILINGLSSIKEVSDRSLNVLFKLLINLFEQRVFIFFKNYYFLLLENIIGLVFDKDKSFNLDLQLKVLSFLLRITFHLPPLSENENNKMIVGTYLIKTLCTCFNNLTRETIELFVLGLFDLCICDEIFEMHVKDFRIKIYEFWDQ